jgi:hypothetical protein
MDGENPADHILIYRSSKGKVDLIGNLGTPPSWIALFHLDDSAIKSAAGPFGPGFVRSFVENKSRYFR